jgi:hypothetical protein
MLIDHTWLVLRGLKNNWIQLVEHQFDVLPKSSVIKRNTTKTAPKAPVADQEEESKEETDDSDEDDSDDDDSDDDDNDDDDEN